MISDSAPGQAITAYHVFGPQAQNSSGLYTNIDGGHLYGRPILVDNVLYGTTTGDDQGALGGLWRINADGSGFTNFFFFSFLTSNTISGSAAFGGLVESGGVLYGTTRNGGTNFTGSIFAINTDGSHFTNLYNFGALQAGGTNSDGAYPDVGFVLSNNVLYGTAFQGGAFGRGTVYRINVDGTGFTNLFSFNGTNGANPEAALILVSGVLYGTTTTGGVGSSTNGVVFGVNIDGTVFTNLHYFSQLGNPAMTNYDGANPQSGLYFLNGLLYGLAPRGGFPGAGYGTLYSVSTNGLNFNTVHYFDFTHGYSAYSELFFANGTFYGTTPGGGAHSTGIIFQIQPDGTGFTDLAEFPKVTYNGISAYTNSVGGEPWAGVIMANNALVGVTPSGGAGGLGTIFALPISASAPVALSTSVSGGSLVFTWPDPSYKLQFSPGLGTPFSNVVGAASGAMIPTTNSQGFFRLVSP